jgi:hypothetical protein
VSKSKAAKNDKNNQQNKIFSKIGYVKDEKRLAPA